MDAGSRRVCEGQREMADVRLMRALAHLGHSHQRAERLATKSECIDRTQVRKFLSDENSERIAKVRAVRQPTCFFSFFFFLCHFFAFFAEAASLAPLSSTRRNRIRLKGVNNCKFSPLANEPEVCSCSAACQACQSCTKRCRCHYQSLQPARCRGRAREPLSEVRVRNVGIWRG